MFESDFDRFYNAYPKKSHRQEAFKAWNRLKPDMKLVIHIIDDAGKRYAGTEVQFVPNPSTYLNQRRWEDAAIEVSAARPRETGAIASLKEAREEKERLTPEQRRANIHRLHEIIESVGK